MKTISVSSNAPILQKTAKITIVRHPAKLSNLGHSKWASIKVYYTL